jgi:protein O-GlcNAc transferase
MNENSTITEESVGAILEDAVTHHRAGRLEQAAAAYRRILQFQADHTDALHLLGVASYQTGQHDTAIELIQKAIRIKPGRAEFHGNLSDVYRSAGRLEEAVAAAQRAIAVDPNNGDAYNNLGIALRDLDRLEDAVTALQRAILLKPANAGAYSNLGAALISLSRYGEAVDALRQAITINPGSVEGLNNLGVALKEQGDLDEALAILRRAIELRPDNSGSYKNLATVLKDLNRPDEAREALDQAYRISPEPGIEFRSAMVFPVIPESTEAIARVRADYAERLKAIEAKELTLQDPYLEVGATPFYLAYHGENDRELQEMLARIYLKACPSLAWIAPHCAAGKQRKRGGKIRIGFVSTLLRGHSVGSFVRRIVADLPREHCSVTVLFFEPLADASAAFIRDKADAAEFVPKNLDNARVAIAAMKFDILVYADIGMDPFTYFLAFARLAPVQCVMAGHPVTTGLPAMDYYISAKLLETSVADDQYSEQLAKLDWYPTCYSRPEIPSRPMDRIELELPEAGTLYVCPLVLFKIHPTCDSVFAEILRRDINGWLVFFEDPKSPALHQALLTRFRTTMPDVVERVKVLPFAPREHFMSILIQSDVLLDSFPFGAGTTTFLAMGVGTPMVTWPQQFMRGRSVMWCYREMGIDDCIAYSGEEFVDISVRLGTEPTFRQSVKEKILNTNEVLYDNLAGLKSMARFFENCFSDGGE